MKHETSVLSDIKKGVTYQTREGVLHLKRVDRSQWNGKGSNTPNTDVHIRDMSILQTVKLQLDRLKSADCETLLRKKCF